ncbi:cupin domain-containing protein [Knoellia sp. Soil729]|uniref:cupin domain-containing protein n=1 Tax=Knoellia sp. Soil729 TaxID=1736394 RepID=UPI0006F494B6|nr:cupin domain-containing protein [Knoellia sp. Soil729]KRE41383.1 hypothetical protein ASG74_12590 [Knoellia sp. Soil729]
MGTPAGPETIRLGPQQTLTVLSSDATALKVECRWMPGDPPPTHWHPTQHEHFEVLEGELTTVVDGERRVLQVGESLDVSPRTAHSMWNAGPGPCRATWRVTPAQRTEEMFRALASGRGPLRKAALVWRFRRELRLGRPRS